MSTFELKCRFGNKLVPVQITPVGEDLRLQFPFFRPMIDEVKCMEGKKWHSASKVWTVKNSNRNMFAFDVLTDGSKIAVYDKELKELSPPDVALWNHQDQIFSFILCRHRCIIAAEMRTGKTLPTLKAVEYADVEGCWWVAPKSALRGLEKELRKWKYSKKIELLTYESFKRETDKLLSVSGSKVPSFLVFDECQKLKTPTSQQTKLALELSEEMERYHNGDEYIVGLSGTPAPKDPSDWWSICEVIRPGFIRESNKNMLARRLGDWEQKSGAVGQMYWQLKKTIENPKGWIKDEVYKLYKRLNPLVQVHLKKNCLDLPDKVYEIVNLKPSRMVLRVAKTIADTAPNVITAINKLRQLSDGFQYNEVYNVELNRSDRETNYVGSPKTARLKEDLANHEDVGRLIVYAGYQGSVDIITATCRDCGWFVLQADGRGWTVFPPIVNWVEGDNSTEFTSEFALNEMDRSEDSGTIKKLCFVAQTDAAGTGLELSASPTIIYYSNSNSGAGRMQSEDRAHSDNMDKNRGLTIIDYCHLPTDYTIRDSLLNKKDLQGISMGELKQSFKENISETVNEK